ncbi:MAG: DUF5953 family protein [Deltaproteobacteria bacterium]
MSTSRVTGLFYGPPLADGDHRTLEIVTALEAAVPGVRLDHVVTSAGTAGALPDRDAFLREASARREFPFVFHGDEARYVGVRGREPPAILMPARQAMLEVWVTLPLAEPVASLAEAVGQIGNAARASWGAASPIAAAATIALQIMFAGRPLPAGLPGLLPPDKLLDPLVPHCLGWLNYWSERTAHELGFPDGARDAVLLQRSLRIGNAWVVRLTDEPLDLERDDHRALLRDIYDRFPAIGGRV